MSVEATVYCEECGNEADRALCQKHVDRSIENAFEEGKKEGEEEGYKRGYAEAEAEFAV